LFSKKNSRCNYRDTRGNSSGTLNAEVLVRKLESTLKGTGFDPLTMAHVIQGAMLMSLPTARKWLISKILLT
jgi:hypothetical protein